MMSRELARAVWAAVYVEVLSARGGEFSIPADSNIDGVAEALANPTHDRMLIAIDAADKAVRRLDRALTSNREGVV